MRELPETYRLSFILPDGADDVAPAAADGCVIIVHRLGLVAIEGPSREAVFACAPAVARAACARITPVSVAGVLMTPGRGLCGRDSWSIIVGAHVAFSPTALPP